MYADDLRRLSIEPSSSNLEKLGRTDDEAVDGRFRQSGNEKKVVSVVVVTSVLIVVVVSARTKLFA